ncbi:hypothetical protein FE839_08505, partial [Klebsiella indica]
VSPVPLHPRHCAENLPLRGPLHSGFIWRTGRDSTLLVPSLGLALPGPAQALFKIAPGNFVPVSTRPLAAVLAASPGCAPAFSPGFLDAPNPHAVSPLFVRGFSEAENHKKSYILYISARSIRSVSESTESDFRLNHR